MGGSEDRLSPNPRQSFGVLNSRWQALCDRYLPITREGSIWRYSRASLPNDPEQGWKLHVPATILTAGRALRKIGPLLSGRGVLYKAPVSLPELGRLNSGIFYGYSQVGKFLTIYPQTAEEAVLLARELHRLTHRMSAPSVPFDGRYQPDGCVYYRYGAFNVIDMQSSDGEPAYAIRDPHGQMVEDVRDAEFKPDWVIDPFNQPPATQISAPATPLQTTFRAFRALRQRGRGGVYQAADLSVSPPRLCILKEGRKNGEVNWDGRDGFWRIKHERRVLALLAKKGVNVPRVYASFEAGQNCFVAVEFIDGEVLGTWLGRKQRRISINAALRLGAELARIVSTIHAAGWVWRDCKPGNIVVTNKGKLRPLDFEGACPVNNPDPLPWGTTAYMPPEGSADFRGQSRLPEDLYAIGAVIFYLLTGRTLEVAPAEELTKLRKGIPFNAREVVMKLLDPDPHRRPQAQAVALRLEALCH